MVETETPDSLAICCNVGCGLRRGRANSTGLLLLLCLSDAMFLNQLLCPATGEMTSGTVVLPERGVNRNGRVHHGSRLKACSSAQDEKACLGSSPQAGFPTTRMAVISTGFSSGQ